MAAITAGPQGLAKKRMTAHPLAYAARFRGRMYGISVRDWAVGVVIRVLVTVVAVGLTALMVTTFGHHVGDVVCLGAEE
jgi:hypothetical protein